MDTKRQFQRLKEQFEKEKREAMTKPLGAEEFSDAVAKMKAKFEGGKLF